jgi:nicotinamidase-related amidase
MISANRHPALLRPEDTLLVVTDLQEPFLRHLWERERVVERCATLIRAAHALLVPVVATLQNEGRMGGAVPEIAALLPESCPIFDKMTFSCLGSEAFENHLRYCGRRQVLLCGAETHICISQTAHDLLARGYQAQVAADAVSSRSKVDHKLALRRMERAGVVLTTTEAAVFELLGRAGTDQFREVLKLVK